MAYSGGRHGKRMKAGQGVRLAALLTAVLAHAAMAYVLATSRGYSLSQPPVAESATTLTVQLRSGAPVSPAGAALPSIPEPGEQTRSGRDDPQSRSQPARDEKAALPITQPSGPYYFRQRELTQTPAIAHDAADDLVVRAPGLPPQPVILRLLLNDEGGVDRVLVEDSYLSAEVERHVIGAFSRLRFQPGRIGRIAVRSQLRIEARLESIERRLPGTDS